VSARGNGTATAQNGAQTCAPPPVASVSRVRGLSPAGDALRVELILTGTQLDLIADGVAERLQPPPAPSPWLNTKQAAAYLACKPDRIHDLCQLGRLHPHKDGSRSLFRREDLDACLEAPSR
jgi:excisionase family DNA binding protein